MTKITLSFDNGPDPEITPHVLKVLRHHEIKGSFFVLGDKLRDRRKLCDMAYADGHWIGNHTYNHLVPLGMSLERGYAAAEITRTQELLGDLAHPRRFFRPYGAGGILDCRLLNREAVDCLVLGRYTCVIWNVVVDDWVYPETWVERALDRCFATQEALLVLHDLPTGAMNKLDAFILAAQDRGATFRQEFPNSCVPIERGLRVSSIDHLVSDMHPSDAVS